MCGQSTTILSISCDRREWGDRRTQKESRGKTHLDRKPKKWWKKDKAEVRPNQTEVMMQQLREKEGNKDSEEGCESRDGRERATQRREDRSVGRRWKQAASSSSGPILPAPAAPRPRQTLHSNGQTAYRPCGRSDVQAKHWASLISLFFTHCPRRVTQPGGAHATCAIVSFAHLLKSGGDPDTCQNHVLTLSTRGPMRRAYNKRRSQ